MRQHLVQPQCRPLGHAARPAQGLGRPQDQVSVIQRHPFGKGAGHGQRQPFGGGGADLIADIGKHHQTVEQVIPIRPLPGHMQGQVDLGGGQTGGQTCDRPPGQM